jgi:hypothetical protein
MSWGILHMGIELVRWPPRYPVGELVAPPSHRTLHRYAAEDPRVGARTDSVFFSREERLVDPAVALWRPDGGGVTSVTGRRCRDRVAAASRYAVECHGAGMRVGALPQNPDAHCRGKRRPGAADTSAVRNLLVSIPCRRHGSAADQTSLRSSTRMRGTTAGPPVALVRKRMEP